MPFYRSNERDDSTPNTTRMGQGYKPRSSQNQAKKAHFKRCLDRHKHSTKWTQKSTFAFVPKEQKHHKSTTKAQQKTIAFRRPSDIKRTTKNDDKAMANWRQKAKKSGRKAEEKWKQFGKKKARLTPCSFQFLPQALP